jgi:hypothetical protein
MKDLEIRKTSLSYEGTSTAYALRNTIHLTLTSLASPKWHGEQPLELVIRCEDLILHFAIYIAVIIVQVAGSGLSRSGIQR